jgi:hypothetical protein
MLPLNRLIVLLLLLFQLVPGYLFSQNLNLHYSIQKGSTPIGTMDIFRSDSSGCTVYKTVMNARLCLVFFVIQVRDTKMARFTGRSMQYCSAERRIHGKSTCSRETVRKGRDYTDGKKKLDNIRREVDYATVQLFTLEPEGKSTVFSEYYQQEYKLECIEPHHYRVKMADGNVGDYYYRSGICYKIVTETRWATVTSLLQAEPVATQ